MTGNPSFEELVRHASREGPGADGEPTPEWISAPGAADVLARLRRVIRLLRADDLKPVPDDARRLAWSAFGRRPAPGAAGSWIEGAVRVIAGLLSDSRTQPAMGGYRGSETAVRLAYESAAGPVDLQVTALPGMADGLHRVRGRFLPAGSEPVEVAATRPGSPEAVAATATDPGGRFELELAAGAYDLVIRLADDDRVVVVPDLEVGRREA